MSVEAWKSFFDSAAVILLFLTFIAGAGVLFTGNIINERQAKQLRQFDQDLRDKDVKIAEAKTEQDQLGTELADAVARGKEADARISEATTKAKAAEAQVASAKAASDDAVAKVAEADAHSAEASAKAEGFRLDIAKANERAADANRIAEQERLARLQLEARLADRDIAPDQQQRLTSSVAVLKGKTVDISTFGETPEIVNVSSLVISCFRNAGVLINTANPMGGGSAVRGILVGLKPGAPSEFAQAANAIVAVLRDSVGGGVGLWGFDKMNAPGGMLAVSQATGAEKLWDSPLRIFIGSK